MTLSRSSNLYIMLLIWQTKTYLNVVRKYEIEAKDDTYQRRCFHILWNSQKLLSVREIQLGRRWPKEGKRGINDDLSSVFRETNISFVLPPFVLSLSSFRLRFDRWTIGKEILWSICILSQPCLFDQPSTRIRWKYSNDIRYNDYWTSVKKVTFSSCPGWRTFMVGVSRNESQFMLRIMVKNEAAVDIIWKKGTTEKWEKAERKFGREKEKKLQRQTFPATARWISQQSSGPVFDLSP